MHAVLEDPDGTGGHDGLRRLPAGVPQEVAERHAPGAGDLFPASRPPEAWRSRHAHVHEQGLAAQRLELLAQVLGLLALGIERGQDADDLGHGGRLSPWS